MTIFEIAYRLLGQYETSGTYVNLALNSHLLDGISKKDRAVLTALLPPCLSAPIRIMS